MNKVLIIRNNDRKNKIYENALESYHKGERKRYYSPKSLDVKELKELREISNKQKILLLISYTKAEPTQIEDIFIGNISDITEDGKIIYLMKVHMEYEKNSRAIESIIDKIDLNISEDFSSEQYIKVSSMESLYSELRERVDGRNDVTTDSKETKIKELEEYVLSPLAQRDQQAIRVYNNTDIGEYRNEFQRDRERVVNCKAFRRMVDKAQIFSAEKGDYYRTRMTHSLEVNQIAKAIAYALKLNLDLTEAIALGHDLGHTPFGHQGERTLNAILLGEEDVGIVAKKNMFEQKCFGGFKHNYQSARILTAIEEKYVEYPGLNVSIQVVEGVLKHTRIKPKEVCLNDFLSKEYIEKININMDSEIQVCSALEGQVVAVADEIAQRGHDVDDALTSGVMTIEEFCDRLKVGKCSKLSEKIIKEIEIIKDTERLIADNQSLVISRIVTCIINYLVTTTIEYSLEQMQNYTGKEITLQNTEKIVSFSPEVEKVNEYLERVVQKKVICNSEVARADYNASVIVKNLFEKYYSNPRLLHSGTIHKMFIETIQHRNKAVANSAINLNDGKIKLVNDEIKEMTKDEIDEELISKYLKEEESVKVKYTDKSIINFEKRKILVRAITDYIAGMTDGYALEEYKKLEG